MKTLVCDTCGYRELTGEAPEKCPNCMVDKTHFAEQDNAIMEPGAQEMEETDKKHIPAVTIKKECGMIPEGCMDALIRIGEVLHPMTEDHSIQFIDAYVDKKWITRLHLSPAINPAVVLHLKPETTGKLQVVELCNKHGAWLTEVDL